MKMFQHDKVSLIIFLPDQCSRGGLLCVRLFAPHESDLYDNNAG